MLYTGANMHIILNSHLSCKIELKRGVRQGDPLSPLLYVLCVGVLASQIRSFPFISGFCSNAIFYLSGFGKIN